MHENLSKVCDKHGEYETKLFSIYGQQVIEKPCPKCMEDNERSWEHSREQEAARRYYGEIEKNTRQSGIPRRYTESTFGQYVVSCQCQADAVAFMKSYAATFDASNGAGVVLCGNHGTGKTMLAAAIGNTLLRTGKKVYYSITSEFLHDVKRTWGRESETSEDDVLKPLRNADLLILDEIGVQFDTDAEKIILFRLLNQRYNDKKATIIVSNKDPEGVKSLLTERVCDRILEGGGAWIACTWESYRTKAGAA